GYIYMFWLTTSTDAASATADPSALLTPSPLPSPRSRRASSAPRDSSSSSPQANNDPSPSYNILLKIGRASNVQRRMNEWTRQCGYSLSLIRYYPYLPSSTPSSSSAGQSPQASPRKVPHAHKVERLIHLELAEKRIRRDCDVCGKEHREWFEVSGDRQGVKGVDEVVKRWGQLFWRITSSMPSDKDRLYVALYARGGSAKREPGSDEMYHWALLVGPKSDGEDDRRIRYHARDSFGRVWEYEEREIYRATSIMLLARVIVAKVTNVERLQAALRSVPVVQGDESWNCVSWVKNALEAVKVDGKAVGTSNLDWDVVRRTAKDYVQGKKDAHRYDGLGLSE
ncbi:MAG: hypothetical protein L6R35_004940, partial [Caloplaca aegaea]